MKTIAVSIVLSVMSMLSLSVKAQQSAIDEVVSLPTLYIDIHKLEPGKVHFADVAKAQEKDLAVQGKYGVNFLKYWVDEKAGVVMCLSEAKESKSGRGNKFLIRAYISVRFALRRAGPFFSIVLRRRVGVDVFD